jgi:hypothetical protein
VGVISHLPYQMIGTPFRLISVLVAIYWIVEVVLLVGAAVTVCKPAIQNRFIYLMMCWPYGLMMPFTIIKNRLSPQQFFPPREDGRTEQLSAEVEDVDYNRGDLAEEHELEPSRTPSEGFTSRPSPQQESLLDKGSPPSPDEYRKALQLLIRHVETRQGDRDLLDLFLRQISASEPEEKPRQLSTNWPVPPRQ